MRTRIELAQKALQEAEYTQLKGALLLNTSVGVIVW